jgi:hypothetical protein
MHQYKIIARILLILPIINFAFAIPIAVKETRQVCCDVPDVAIAISEKRGEETKKQWDMHFERMSGKPESSSAAHRASGSARSESDDVSVNGNAPRQSPASSTAPDQGSTSSPQMDTSETQQVSQELSKSPSLDHYVQTQPELSNSPSLDHYLQSQPALSNSPSLDHNVQTQPELSKSPPLDHNVQTQPELSKSPSLDHNGLTPLLPPSSESDARVDDTISTMKRPKFKLKSIFQKVLSKLKFRRHMSGPGFARDAELHGLVDTAGYVYASSSESQTFLLDEFPQYNG